MLKYNKTIITRMFNIRFKDFIKRIQKKLSDDEHAMSQIDILSEKIKGNGNRIIIHLFVDYIVSNDEVSKNIKKGNDKFFDNIIYKNNTIKEKFMKLKQMYQKSKYLERKYILKKINNLRKLAVKYTKVSE